MASEPQKREVSVTVPGELARELREQYPEVLRLSEGLRVAAGEAVQRRREACQDELN